MVFNKFMGIKEKVMKWINVKDKLPEDLYGIVKSGVGGMTREIIEQGSHISLILQQETK